MHDKHQVTEEPCKGKLLRTVLESNGSRKRVVDFNRTNQQPRNKTERRRSNSWAFNQLRLFIDYKALGAGVKVVMVNPAYTSLTCHHCLHIHPVIGESYRNGKRFVCGHCGWHGDADLNGARNIKTIGLSVIQPGGSWLSCEIAGGLLKLPGLMDAPALYRLSGQPGEDVTHTTFS